MNKKIIAVFCLSLWFTLQTVSAQTYIISTYAGNGVAGNTGDGGPKLRAKLNLPWGCAIDGKGNFYIADYNNSEVRKISAATGQVSSIGGNLSNVTGVAVDTAGNVYICDWWRERIVKVDKNNVATTFAGGKYGFAGDGGPADTASMTQPYGVAVDKTGNVYIADAFNNRIRKVDTKGIITTVAGNGNQGFSGNGGPATNASLSIPVDVAVDTSGNLFISETGNRDIRKVDKNGVISTYAGNGGNGYSGDGGPATSASLGASFNLAVDDSGNVYISNTYNYRIRKVYTNGTINTIAGVGVVGFKGDNDIADSAKMNQPFGICTDHAGNIYFCDQSNNRIRRLSTCSSNINVLPKQPRLCKGTGLGLDLAIENIYQWSPSIGLNQTTGGDIIANPLITTTYTITGTICNASGTLVVTVDTFPVVKVTPTHSVICEGQTITLNASGANNYRWSPFRGLSRVTGSTVIATGGFNTTYTVVGTNILCGTKDSVVLTVGNSFNIASVTASHNPICPGTPETLHLYGNVGSLQWQSSDSLSGFKNIAGATDSTYSFTPEKTAYYRVISSNGTCGDTSTHLLLNVEPEPVVSFTTYVKGMQVYFTPVANSYVTYSWNFGDNVTSTDSLPMHTYANGGTYNVCLTAYNSSNCSYTICNKLNVGAAASINNISGPGDWSLFPNPAEESTTLQINGHPTVKTSITLSDALGRVVYTQIISTAKTEIRLNKIPSGTYFIHLQSGTMNNCQMLIKN